MLYRPPTVAQLKQWKEKLGYSGSQMSRILGLKSARRWREYADESKQQGIPPANLFMAAAMVTLTPQQITGVLSVMREVGAEIDLDAESEPTSK
ncbi:XRE family transcriptional regulator [Burkholderia cenocepacia]|uniref:XRE family transcriptional regulator n=1 Tax=Burkholderia cenocepacia TaxID=95486 RepID=UPI001BACFAFB|nr:XRE family transcriptional regulator [Burkholderia cenocepacia]QUN42413.1 XRE family transcriptional regulator [Burkholderia cenocepacia]QUO26186.1 XRE family transcriptional regulator [Burkholderia cenocepacia]